MSMRLEVKNYRGLRHVDWSPHGVCALTGPNGAGKTSLLSVLAFLRDALADGLGRAVDRQGGVGAFRHFDAKPDEPTEFKLTLGQLTWSLEPVFHGSGIGGIAGESLQVANDMAFRRQPNEMTVTHSADTFAWLFNRLDDTLVVKQIMHLVRQRNESQEAKPAPAEKYVLSEDIRGESRCPRSWRFLQRSNSTPITHFQSCAVTAHRLPRMSRCNRE